MTIFFIKSLLSLLLLGSAAVAAATMLQALGGRAAPNAAGRLKKIHKAAGYFYLACFSVISYLCIGFLAESRAEPSPRAVLHILVSLVIIALFPLKVLFVRAYRSFYGQVSAIGITMTVLTVLLVGISSGYYLTVSRFGTDTSVDKSVHYALKGILLTVIKAGDPGRAAIKKDLQSIDRGRTLFLSNCAGCHDPNSANPSVGPGLKGILKRPVLPVSKHPATVDSIRFQLRQPLGRMPSFDYLSEEQLNDLIAYLNTL